MLHKDSHVTDDAVKAAVRPFDWASNVVDAEVRRKLRNCQEFTLARFGQAPKHRPRFRNPLLGGMGDVINQPLYDSFSVANNTAFPITTLFAQPFGTAGKQRNQTNLQINGQLPPPQKFVIFALRLFISNDTVIADMNNILRNVLVTFVVGTKEYFAGPPLLLTAGCGAMVTAVAQVGTAPVGAAVNFATSNGTPVQQNVYSLTRPIVVESGEVMSVVLNPLTGFSTQAGTTNPPGVGTTIYAILDGELYRQVQ